MTTEREFAEWAEKIRRVRGQAPRNNPTKSTRPRPGLAVILFLVSLAIALGFNHYRQQQGSQLKNGFPNIEEYRF